MKRSRKSLLWEHSSLKPDPQRAGNTAESRYPKKEIGEDTRSSSQAGRMSELGGFEVNLWGIRADPQQSHHLCIFSWTLTTAWPGFLAALSGKRDFWCPAGILRCLEHRFLFPTDGSAQENNPFPPHIWKHSRLSQTVHRQFSPEKAPNWDISGQKKKKKECHVCTHSLFLSVPSWLQETG